MTRVAIDLARGLLAMNRALEALIVHGPAAAAAHAQWAREFFTDCGNEPEAPHAELFVAWKLVDEVEDAIRQAQDMATQPRRISEMYESRAIEESGNQEAE